MKDWKNELMALVMNGERSLLQHVHTLRHKHKEL